jgi:hypothetical protein
MPPPTISGNSFPEINMPTINDVKGLDGHVTIDNDHYGDIRCKTLTVTRRGHLRGNAVCDILECGGKISGIVICRLPLINENGTILGALYHSDKPRNQGFVAPTIDFREPPAAVWAIVMPDMLAPVEPNAAPSDEAIDFAFSSFADLDLTVSLEAAPQVAVPVPVELYEAPVVGKSPVAELVASTDNIDEPALQAEAFGTLVLELGPKAPKLNSQPLAVARSNASRELSPQPMSTGRRVKLPGFNFGSQNTNA